MKVIAISYDDYSNFGYSQIEALKSIGVSAEGYKLVAHPFGYAEQSPVINKVEMMEKIRDADIILILHSWIDGLKMCLECGKKRLAVYHTGSLYRQNPQKMNGIFNPYVSVAITDECEFIGTGMKNEQYIATAVDTDKIKFVDKEIKLPYIIAHYPSNPEVKGTQKIVEMMSKIQSDRFKFVFDFQRVVHAVNMIRIAACDIYIEMFQPTLNGKPYGCWGVTAFEAAAMGKVVVTNNINLKAYTDAYIYCPFEIANTETEFIEAIKRVCDRNENGFASSWMRNLIITNHSYPATGQRIKSILEKI